MLAFLRRIKYFKGLLFLTTNAYGQIDPTFISRAHIAIEYNDLNAESIKKIWNVFFQKLAKERAGKIEIACDVEKWILETTVENYYRFNGRHIRNTLQTAIALAEFEAEEGPDYSPEMVIFVTKYHFKRVLDLITKS